MNLTVIAHAITAIGLALAATPAANAPPWMLPLGLVIGAIGKGLAAIDARTSTGGAS